MVSDRFRSTRPSRTSCTAFTSAACSRNMKNRLTIAAAMPPPMPTSDSSAPMMAETTYKMSEISRKCAANRRYIAQDSRSTPVNGLMRSA